MSPTEVAHTNTNHVRHVASATTHSSRSVAGCTNRSSQELNEGILAAAHQQHYTEAYSARGDPKWPQELRLRNAQLNNCSKLHAQAPITIRTRHQARTSKRAANAYKKFNISTISEKSSTDAKQTPTAESAIPS